MFNIQELINTIGPCKEIVCGPVIPLAAFLAPSLISAGSSLISNLFNIGSTRKTNDTNMAINQQNLDFTAAMTRQAWERDDNAHQREVRDLEAAGLSPLANTTGSQVTAPNSAPSPIAMQAPQIDSTSLANSILQAGQLHETIRHNKAMEGQKETELTNQAEQIKNQAASIEIENKKVQQTIKYQADLIDLQAKQIEEVVRSNKAQEELKKLSYQSEQYWKEIEEQTGGKCPSKDFYDFDIYKVYKNLWDLEYKQFLTKIGATSTASGSSNSQNLSGGFGLGAGAAGPNGNINAAEGTSHSEYKSENLSQKQEAMLHQWYSEHPMPVFHDFKKGK